MTVLVRKSSLPTLLVAGLLSIAFASTTLASDTVADGRENTIVFVCLHGSVKSQMASAHFNRVARERGLPFRAVSRGVIQPCLLNNRVERPCPRAQVDETGAARNNSLPPRFPWNSECRSVVLMQWEEDRG